MDDISVVSQIKKESNMKENLLWIHSQKQMKLNFPSSLWE
jgi:hypothetical protein